MNRRFGRIRRLHLVFVAATVAVLSAAVAAQTGLNEQIRSQLESAKARLKLTDAQREKAEPIIRDGIQRRMAIFKKHGLVDENGRRTGTTPPLRQLRGIREELEAVHKDNTAKLGGILTPTQMEEFKKIQEEAREALRERATGR